MDIQWKQPSPKTLLAREIVCAHMHERDVAGADSFGAYVRAGLRDDCPEMRICLAALDARPQ